MTVGQINKLTTEGGPKVQTQEPAPSVPQSVDVADESLKKKVRQNKISEKT